MKTKAIHLQASNVVKNTQPLKKETLTPFFVVKVLQTFSKHGE